MPELLDTTKSSSEILTQLETDFEKQQQKDESAAAAAATTTDGAAAAAATSTQDEELEYTVDLGDGQKLTFVGKDEAELQGKVEAALKEALKAKATAAATTSAAATAAAAKPVSKRKQLSKDEEFAVAQEIRSGNLVEGLRKFFEAHYGLTPERADEINQEVDEQKAYRTATVATAAFLEKHEDFVQCDHNKKLIGNYLTSMGKMPTLENLEDAYKTLKEGNLLITEKPAAAATNGTNGTNGAAATTTTTTTRKTAPSGLFGRRGAAAGGTRSDKKVPTDAELEKIAKEGGSDALLAHLEAINS